MKLSVKITILYCSFLLQALIHGLNRHYYSIAINYRKNELEQKMLMNLNKKSWMDGLSLKDYNDHCSLNQVGIREIHQRSARLDRSQRGFA